ncbi:MAG: putative Ig domain-containing protein, partial [Bacteroidota bacterium]
KKMKSPLSSDSREASASMSLNGNLYFSSNRNCEGKENCYTADLFCSELINNSYRDATAITNVNSESDEESIFVSPQEDYLIFCSYTDNITWMDLYISYRDANNQWTTPQRVDASINSKDWDRRPYVSMDNQFLFFTRLQIEETGLKESDIYWVKTSKLFKPFVYRPLSNFTVKSGEPFEIDLPLDLFKDIDGDALKVSLETKLDGLTFEADHMKLSGTANFEDSQRITFTATDSFSNKVQHQITLVANE